MHDTLAMYRRLQAFDIDGDAPALSFPARLARENGWTPDLARRVVDEYKRFVALAMTAGHPVTPSEHVDQAWHLHLAYTESYWSRMCGQVLPRPLHHNPTRGGAKENEKFDEWYARTLASYARAFGHPPPEDIWPAPATRFGHDLHWERVNTSDNWVVSKRRLARRAGHAAVGAVLVGVVVALTLAGPAVMEPGVAMLALVGPVGALAGACYGVGHARRRGLNAAGPVVALALGGAALAGFVHLGAAWVGSIGMSDDAFALSGFIILAMGALGIAVIHPAALSTRGSRTGGGGGGCGAGLAGCGSDSSGCVGGGCGGGGCGGCGG